MNIKTSPVHFYVQRNSHFSRSNAVLTFEVERLNLGGAMNINTGVFTAPCSGTYHFSFAFMKNGQVKPIRIYIRKNGVAIGAAFTHAYEAFLQSSLSVTLKLKLGDTVDLFQIGEASIYDDETHFNHFTGWLIEEDLDEKLNSLMLPPISTATVADPFCKTKGFPKSCQDLRCRGHTTDGFYLVQSVPVDNKIDIIYCDFSHSNPTHSTIQGI